MKSTRFTKLGNALSDRFSRKVWLAICLTGALSLWWGTPAVARFDGNSGWVKTVETFTLDHIEINGCFEGGGGEDVYMTGQAEIETWIMTDGNGITHIKQWITLISQGVGETSGATYILKDTVHSTEKIADPFPFSLIEFRTARLVGIGVPDQTLKYKTILRVNAQGEITREVADFKMRCGQ
jgi:hypothetical protein